MGSKFLNIDASSELGIDRFIQINTHEVDPSDEKYKVEKPFIDVTSLGLFSSNVEDSFILTYEDKININELN